MTDHIPEVDGRRRRRGSDPKERAERPGQSRPANQPAPRPVVEPSPQTDYVEDLLGQAPAPSQSQQPRPSSSSGSGLVAH